MRPADLTLDLLGRGERATLRVQGRSMWPTLIEGDRVVIAPRDEYQVGDLLAFDVGKPSLTVHRLLQKDEGRLRTRGDGMEYVDPWLEPDQVAGVVVRVERGWRSALYNRWFQPMTLGAWRRRWRRRIDGEELVPLRERCLSHLSHLAQTVCSFCSDHHLDTG